MKILSDDEIQRVFEIAQTKATEFIKSIEERAILQHQEIYQLRKKFYESQMQLYKAQLATHNEPIPPIKPPLDTTSTIPILSHSNPGRQNKTFFSFSAYTQKQLKKIEYLTDDNKTLIHQITSREFYIQQRIEMEKTAFGSSAIPDGLLGEMLVVFELELYKQAGNKGIILHNLEIEIGNQTIQTDVVFITQKGIFVIESKNFSGRISGAERMNKWVLQTPKRQYNFFNPIMQNRSHINVLTNILPNVKFYSLIAFSERSYLEYIDIHCADTFVCNFYAIRDVIDDVFSTDRDSISPQGLNLIAEKLRRYSADDPTSNPNFKESRSYFSSRSKIKPSQENTSGNLPPFQLEDFIIE